MPSVTFQVLEGIDKGRIFRALPTPVTIGREEGNVLRLNDERVSRFHAKVQLDNGDLILTDLESTNGTRVNGNTVQIRRLRPGDRVALGRSLLLFGSDQEISARNTALQAATVTPDPTVPVLPAEAGVLPTPERAFAFGAQGEVTVSDSGSLFIGGHTLPPLPQKLTPAQIARLAEIFDFIHAGLTSATDEIEANEDGTEVSLAFGDWQKVLAVQMLLARYLRAVADPDGKEE